MEKLLKNRVMRFPPFFLSAYCLCTAEKRRPITTETIPFGVVFMRRQLWIWRSFVEDPHSTGSRLDALPMRLVIECERACLLLNVRSKVI